MAKRRARPTTNTRRLIEAMSGVKGNKFRAKGTVVDGLWFASKREARRWQELKLLERSGSIRNLRRQVRYKLVQTVHYVADFVYLENDQEIVEDSKGCRTDTYVRKRRLMKEQHGIEIRET